MKKLWVPVLILFAVFMPFKFKFVWNDAYGALISVSPFSADSAISHLNHMRTTFLNWANGGVEGSGIQAAAVNILADSLGELDMADEINPRVRDNELLGLTTANSGYVYSGCTPATSANLTSDVSACTAYVNGYRVTRTATSQTYTASRDTYLDISQTAAYTQAAVANGAAAPAVTANSIRLALVVTDADNITSVTDQANRRIPNLIVPSNYRDGLLVSQDSTSAITVFPGVAEINNSSVSKTTVTTLNLGTAGDWAGGTSLRAALTYGYVGVDSSGNIKLHTTRPSHQNYALTVTNGKGRYASWSSTTYRILGWFFMDGSQTLPGTISQDTSGVSNIAEHGIPNSVMKVGTTDITSGTSWALMDSMDVSVDTTGGYLNALFTAPILDGTGNTSLRFLVDGVERVDTEISDSGGDIAKAYAFQLPPQRVTPGTHTVRVQWLYQTGTASTQVATADGERVLTVYEQ